MHPVGEDLPIRMRSTGSDAGADVLACRGKDGDGVGPDAGGHPAGQLHHAEMPSKPNPVTSVIAWTSIETTSAGPIQRRHELDGVSDRILESSSFLAAVVMMPRPIGLVRTASQPGCARRSRSGGWDARCRRPRARRWVPPP